MVPLTETVVKIFCLSYGTDSNSMRFQFFKMKSFRWINVSGSLPNPNPNPNNNNNNNNNKNPFLYSAFRDRGLSDVNTPGHWALNHLLNHLSSPLSVQPVRMRYSAKPSTSQEQSARTGTRLPLGREKQL